MATYFCCEEDHSANTVHQCALDGEEEHGSVDYRHGQEQGIETNVEEKGWTGICDLIHLEGSS